MGGFANLFDPSQQNSQIGAGLSGLGAQIAKIGNASSGVIPQGASGGSQPMAMPQTKPGVMTTPQAIGAMQGSANPANLISTVDSGVTNTIPTSAPSTAAPTAAGGAYNGTAIPGGGTPTTNNNINTPGGTVSSGDLNSVYGNDTGELLTNLLNEENPGNANSTAQTIINANAPNVAQGSANLNTGLAASGISPSSSVSAIENANYQGQVAQQDASEIAQVNMTEQQMQQQLVESLLPSQQQRQTDSSGWSIFGDIMGGIGDVATLGLAGL